MMFAAQCATTETQHLDWLGQLGTACVTTEARQRDRAVQREMCRSGVKHCRRRDFEAVESAAGPPGRRRRVSDWVQGSRGAAEMQASHNDGFIRDVHRTLSQVSRVGEQTTTQERRCQKRQAHATSGAELQVALAGNMARCCS